MMSEGQKETLNIHTYVDRILRFFYSLSEGWSNQFVNLNNLLMLCMHEETLLNVCKNN